MLTISIALSSGQAQTYHRRSTPATLRAITKKETP